MTAAPNVLKKFTPRHASFVGIDSDGCVFDTMEAKQKKCFHPEIIRHWGLEEIAEVARETAEFFSLYSKWRGLNRFQLWVLIMDALRKRPDVRASGVRVPPVDALRAIIESGLPLSNATLRGELERGGDPELMRVLDWSVAVDARVDATVKGIKPIVGVERTLEKMGRDSDMMVISQTPGSVIKREWEANGMDRYVALIAGQEWGTKVDHLTLAALGKCRSPERILMIGDAPGDLQAARETGVCFYPIKPGAEIASWAHLYAEAYDLFLAGAYVGAYQDGLVKEFEALLPDQPPWKPETL